MLRTTLRLFALSALLMGASAAYAQEAHENHAQTEHEDHNEHAAHLDTAHHEAGAHEAHAEMAHDEHGEASTDTAEAGLDITALIMHHISDSHEWHFFDYNGEPYSIALPIIVYTDNGFSVFSSSVFHHDDAGHHVYTAENGDRFIKVHDKIYLASEEEHHGSWAMHDEEHNVLNAKPTLDLSITKNVINLFIGAALMLLVFLVAARKYEGAVPRGIASFMEPLIVFVRDDIALQNIGKKKYERFVPYLLTLFFFIWINNVLGLFPGGANLTGNISFTMTLAVLSLIIVNVNANKDYWKHIFWMPGVPVWVRIMLAPIELVGVFTKPFALMIRLFANMTAGHIVILSLISLTFIFESYLIAPASVALTLFIYIIKVLVAFLQAYIFALLTALFIGQAVEEHDHH